LLVRESAFYPIVIVAEPVVLLISIVEVVIIFELRCIDGVLLVMW
jgi:hypothetical protein